MRGRGTIYLVGAGPGPGDWLTLRAARTLARAEVVVHDRLVSQEVLAFVNPRALRFCVESETLDADLRQARILRMLEFYAARYRFVVRLKGGDPFVFGRGGEEWEWLSQRGWRVEVIPGISSALALPAAAGIPPTFRGLASAFAVVAGCQRSGAQPDWERYARVDTLIILMGVQRRASIASALIRAGRPPTQPCCFIENGGTERERVVVTQLADVADGRCEVCSPAVWIVGDVVALRDRILDAAQPEMAWTGCRSRLAAVSP
ncbi:MAG: uroporphyrinogen-III C-methyltransferase [Bryobacterales bacterium]|nr:uroporphyrinogen-III C-methyltransferase [Bryobacteraceae bacterium]MDW8129882.1 uroporphyrinogen-III C-methyltransferase [Bryobacterales bacterium]